MLLSSANLKDYGRNLLVVRQTLVAVLLAVASASKFMMNYIVCPLQQL
jgi:hypothetical protein